MWWGSGSAGGWLLGRLVRFPGPSLGQLLHGSVGLCRCLGASGFGGPGSASSFRSGVGGLLGVVLFPWVIFRSSCSPSAWACALLGGSCCAPSPGDPGPGGLGPHGPHLLLHKHNHPTHILHTNFNATHPGGGGERAPDFNAPQPGLGVWGGRGFRLAGQVPGQECPEALSRDPVPPTPPPNFNATYSPIYSLVRGTGGDGGGLPGWAGSGTGMS